MTEPLSYRNQSIDLPWKSMDWFLCDNGLRQERVKYSLGITRPKKYVSRKINQDGFIFHVTNLNYSCRQVILNTDNNKHMKN